MKIKRLELENFRNYDNEAFEFCDNINVLYGKNGQGKTNVIEALYFFCNGRSYRVSKEKDTVKNGRDYANLKILFESSKRKNIGEIHLENSKMIKLNGINIQKLSELIGNLKAVIFTPDFLELIKDGPSKRRNFLDNFISQIYPLYFKNLVNYYKVLKQKNISLKNKSVSEQMLDVWNESLAKYGSIVCGYRSKMIEKLCPYVKKYQGEMSENKENLQLIYMPSVKEKFYDSEYFYKVLEKNKEREKEAGFSLIGPNRDDFDFIINGKEMKIYGSQGQMRTAVLSLILAQCELINEIFNEYPVLLLDDIMSELDEKRRRYLMNEIKDKQVIITCTEKESFGNFNAAFFEIENGSCKRK